MKISGVHAENEGDLVSASGDYVFRFLANNTPVFYRENAHYQKGRGLMNSTTMSYSLSYQDKQWQLRRKELSSCWQDAKLVFRRKTECEL